MQDVQDVPGFRSAGHILYTGGGRWGHPQGDNCMLVNEWVCSKSRVCLLMPEVDMGAVVESELGLKWR